MKRDVDLIRHLLLEIERHGPDLAVDELRKGAVHESDERTRYHVRLLVAGKGRNVTFPARQYSVNGDRRSFALLRPVTGDATAQERLRELILQAYSEFEQNTTVTT